MDRAVTPLSARAATRPAAAPCWRAIPAQPCCSRCDSVSEVHAAHRTVMRHTSHALSIGCTHTLLCIGINGDMTGKAKAETRLLAFKVY